MSNPATNVTEIKNATEILQPQTADQWYFIAFGAVLLIGFWIYLKMTMGKKADKALSETQNIKKEVLSDDFRETSDLVRTNRESISRLNSRYEILDKDVSDTKSKIESLRTEFGKEIGEWKLMVVEQLLEIKSILGELKGRAQSKD